MEKFSCVVFRSLEPKKIGAYVFNSNILSVAQNLFHGSLRFKVLRIVTLLLANEILCSLLALGHALTLQSFYSAQILYVF